MAEAHRRLMAQLPSDSPYRTTEEETLTRAITALWRQSKAVGVSAEPERPAQTAA
jgi:hypothetical protein